MDFGIEIIIITIMLAINAVFAAYEMALASISRVRLVALVNLHKPGAKEAMFMKDRMEGSLAVTQLTITLVGAIAAATGGLGVDEFLSPLLKDQWGLSKTAADIVSLVCLIIPLSCLTIVCAELIPKTFALKHQVPVCLRLSPAMKVLAFLTYPLIRVLEGIVKKFMSFIDGQKIFNEPVDENIGLHELNAAVAMARTSRLLGVNEEKIVLSAANLSRRMIKEIILPIQDVSMIPASCTLTDALIRAHNDMHTRFPVYEQEDVSPVITGYLNFKDIIAALKINPTNPTVKGIIRPIKTVGDTAPISVVLQQMISEKLHIAMVASPAGMVGMVTLEDIIEELVGEIEDEFDRVPTHVHPYGSSWLMGGGVSMATVLKTVGADKLILTPEEEKLKLADWFEKKIPKAIKAGDSIDLPEIHIGVRKLRRKKLGEAIVTLKSL